MDQQLLIERTLQTLKKLPTDKVIEVADFADFILKKHEEQLLQKGIETMISESETFNFLNEEESLYSIEDIKEKH